MGVPRVGMGVVSLSRGSMEGPRGHGTVLYLDRGGDHANLHEIKLHRTTHTHTQARVKLVKPEVWRVVPMSGL